MRSGATIRSYREVLFHDVVVHMSHGSFRDDGTAVHNIEAIRDIETEIKVLFHKEDSNSASGPIIWKWVANICRLLVLQSSRADFYDRFGDLVDDVGLNALRGLIEQEHLRVGQQGAADGQLLLLA